MDLYRVLLADDEAHIREGISHTVDWASLGFELVGEASNGEEAHELARDLHPDVVLTDVQMPFMTGLELCKHLAFELPATKFIVFSGFDDFEYAKKAIQLQVFEYILKPIDSAELISTLKKLKIQLDSERAERQNLERLESLYNDSLPILRKIFLSRLLDGLANPARLEEETRSYNLDLTAPNWQVALIHLDDISHQHELKALSVCTLFEDQFHLSDAVSYTFLYQNLVAVMVGYTSEPHPLTFIDELNRVRRLARAYSHVELTIGIGEVLNLPRLSRSTHGAKSALDYRILQGSGRTIYIHDLEPDSRSQLAFDELDERNLTTAVKLGSERDVEKAVTNLVGKISQANSPMAQNQLFFLELVNCLLKLTRGGNLDVNFVFGQNFNGSLQITDFASAQAVGDWCLERCLTIQSQLGRMRSDSAGRIINRAKGFIQEHYSDSSLAVETLCSYLNLSPAYFSTLFKRETGQGFAGYVTEVRMAAASDLLSKTNDKTYVIAEQVGYDDPNYFSYVFKKFHGITPSKFRAST